MTVDIRSGDDMTIIYDRTAYTRTAVRLSLIAPTFGTRSSLIPYPSCHDDLYHQLTLSHANLRRTLHTRCIATCPRWSGSLADLIPARGKASVHSNRKRPLAGGFSVTHTLTSASQPSFLSHNLMTVTGRLVAQPANRRRHVGMTIRMAIRMPRIWQCRRSTSFFPKPTLLPILPRGAISQLTRRVPRVSVSQCHDRACDRCDNAC